MRSLFSILLLILASPAPTTAPTLDDTTKSTVANLITQLGADNFKDRESASTQLIDLGPRILPLLRQSKPHHDPEIDNRLQLITKRLEAALFPQPASTAIPIFLNHLSGRQPGIISARNPAPGQVELSATYKKDRLTMLRSANGIEISLECTLNGNLARETYRADSESDLREKFPLAHKLHESLLTSAGYGNDRRWWRQFAAKPEPPATQPAAN
ncbi:MAG TPA: hypothetical protein VGQ99_10915 [Tepidisphaeraceae bacterium]|jgi:hypothetical protein|nr:hypothetical protein [Tepidisphaeraceae bacterium]